MRPRIRTIHTNPCLLASGSLELTSGHMPPQDNVHRLQAELHELVECAARVEDKSVPRSACAIPQKHRGTESTDELLQDSGRFAMCKTLPPTMNHRWRNFENLNRP